VEFDPEGGEPDTRSDPLPEVVELCTVVEVEVDAELVEVTVTVELLWTVVPDALPTPPLLPEPPADPPTGDSRTGAPPIEEGALPLKAWVATTTEPTPARRTRVNTETTDSF
jgi:hypothetical protein